VVVNNAGFVRDRMFFTTSEEEWDAVIRVHLKGHFAVTRHASEYWRARSKAGETVDARIVNTSSGAGLMGSVGQGAYSAAKGGIAALTLVEAAEMARYGVTANAVAPSAITRLTVDAMGRGTVDQTPQAMIDRAGPAHVAPLVVWLASVKAGNVHGEVFRAGNGRVNLFQGWQAVRQVGDLKHAVWEPEALGAAMEKEFFAKPVEKQTMEALMKEMAGA
jgi:NAD(P)-dependent dehydrogenase (short-subunit alcohol dehydrogenase family)